MDPHLALVIDAATFLLSAAFVRFGVQARPPAASAEKRKSFFAMISTGGRVAWSSPALRALVLFTWLMGLLPVYEGIAAPYVSSAGGGPELVGLLLAADPVGSVIGTFVFTRWVPAQARPKLIAPLSALCAVPMLVGFTQPGTPLSIVLFVLSGAFGSVALLQATASLTLAVPDENRAQTMGLSNTGLTTMLGVSPLIGGLLTDLVGPQTTVGIFGVAGVVLTLPLAVAWHRSMNTGTTSRVDNEAPRAEHA